MSREQSLVLSAREAAELLGVSDQTIYTWLDRGVLPEVAPRVSRRRMVPRAAVEQIVASAMDGWDPIGTLEQVAEDLAAAGEQLAAARDRFRMVTR